MKTFKEVNIFNCSAEALWNILSDVARSDWVPSVNSISLKGNIRSFSMDGIGEVAEEILLKDDENMILKYSAVKSPAKINHHLATMQINHIEKDKSQLTWTTEIDPPEFSAGIHHGMLISIEGIKKVIEN